MNRPLLRIGSNGPAVTLMQQALNLGVTMLNLLDVDGIFGPLTLNRVKEFQRQEQLTPDGVAGPLTQEAMEELYQLILEIAASPPGAEASRISVVATAKAALAIFGWSNQNGQFKPPRFPLPGGPQIAARFGFGAKDAQGNQFRQGGMSLSTIFQNAGHGSASRCLLISNAARQMYAKAAEPPAKIRNATDIPEWCGIFVLYVYKMAGLKVSSWPLKLLSEKDREFVPVRLFSEVKKGDFGLISPFDGGRNHHFLVTNINGSSISSIDGNSGLFQSITTPGYTVTSSIADKRGAFRLSSDEPVVFFRPHWDRVL